MLLVFAIFVAVSRLATAHITLQNSFNDLSLSIALVTFSLVVAPMPWTSVRFGVTIVLTALFAAGFLYVAMNANTPSIVRAVVGIVLELLTFMYAMRRFLYKRHLRVG